MVGEHRVVIKTKAINYDITIKRNITILLGDSGTGKSTLIGLIRDYNEFQESSGIDLQCDKECITIAGDLMPNNIESYHDCIIFIDENNKFIFTEEFASVVQGSDNYWVLITRSQLRMLPYSYEEMYGFRLSGKYALYEKKYNEFYRIYNNCSNADLSSVKTIICEDSKSGYQFFNSVCGINCVSANGNSGIIKCMQQYLDIESDVLVFADGAAIGAFFDELIKISNLKKSGKFIIVLPESFEWVLLKSGIIKNNELPFLLSNPENFSEFVDKGTKQNYFSWERLFTKKIIQYTNGTYLQYSKDTLNTNYVTGRVRKAILDTFMELGVDLTKCVIDDSVQTESTLASPDQMIL